MMEQSFTQELSFWLIEMFGFEPGVAVLVALGLCFFAAVFVAGGLAAAWEWVSAARKVREDTYILAHKKKEYL